MGSIPMLTIIVTAVVRSSFLLVMHEPLNPTRLLAFHKPGLEEIQGSPSDADDELTCLKELGVRMSTVNRIRNLSGDEVWYPTHDEMIEYGLITSTARWP